MERRKGSAAVEKERGMIKEREKVMERAVGKGTGRAVNDT